MSTKNAKNVKTKGPAQTPKCTMSGTHIQRFGITPEQNGRGATDFGTVYRSQASARWIKRMTEGMRTLRQMQGKTDTTVPAPVRSAIKYFSIPFARGEEKPVRHKLDAYEATSGGIDKNVPIKV